MITAALVVLVLLLALLVWCVLRLHKRLLYVLLRWENWARCDSGDNERLARERHAELLRALDNDRPAPVVVVVQGDETPLAPLIAFPKPNPDPSGPIVEQQPQTTKPKRTIYLCKSNVLAKGDTATYRLNAMRGLDVRSVTLEGPSDAVIVGVTLNGCNVGAVCARELHEIEGWIVEPAIAMEVTVARREA